MDLHCRYSNEDFFKLYRLQKHTFQRLVDVLNENDVLQRTYPGGNSPVSPQKQVLMTVTYLATQETMLKIADHFCVVQSTVYNSIRTCLKQLLNVENQFIKWPSSERECHEISGVFERKTGFPGILG